MSLSPSFATTELAPGTLFHGKYEVRRLLAKGGMGAVYEVLHTETQRKRALKIMLPSLVTSDELRSRFRTEARVAASIDSEHIVETFDAGVDAVTGVPFLVMEFLVGEELASLVEQRGALSPEEALPLLAQVAATLDRTHAARIVHRDLKPENLFVTKRDDGSPRVKILDFGIAKLVAETTEGAQATKSLGTPLYMAPEQLDTTIPLSAQTDLFALAHITYVCLVGAHYWTDEQRGAPSLYGFLMHIQSGTTLPASQKAAARGRVLPPAFDAWFAKATAKAPTSRFATGRAQHEALVAALGSGVVSGAVALDATARAPTAPARTLHDATGSVDASIAPKPRRRAVRWIGAALALVILAAGGFVVASYTEASRLERAVAADVRAVDAADPEKLTEADLRAFGALMSRGADLESIATAPPLLLRLLFDAPKTLVSVRAARDAFVSRELDHRKRVLEAQLGAAGRDGLRYDADYDGLKLYVALTDRARAKGERAYLEADLAATIQGEMASPVAPEALAPLVHALADAAEAGAIVPDKPTLASAREKLSPALNEAALLGLALAPLTTAPDAYPAWRPFERQPALLALFGEPAQVGIAPEYTTKGRAAVLASLGKLPAAMAAEAWVLDKPVDDRAFARATYAYGDRFAAAWRALFRGLRTDPPKTLEELVALATLGTTPPRPIESLVRGVGEATTPPPTGSLGPEDPGDLRTLLPFLEGSPSPAERYGALLAELVAALRSKSPWPRAADASDVALVKATQLKVTALVLGLPVVAQELLGPALLRPVTLAP